MSEDSMPNAEAPFLWLQAVALRAGPLHGAAKRFLRQQGLTQAHLAFDVTAAIRWLAAAVERQWHDGEAEGEERFVEGAGALLGVLLLARDGAGQHQATVDGHRVALGQWGCFDPFGAIRAALAAEHPRRELCQRVQLAEAESAGTGPVAAVVREFVLQLAALPAPPAVAQRLGLVLRLTDDTEVDLRTVAQVCAGQSTQLRRQAVARVVAMLPQARRAEPLAFARWAHRLLPRVVGPRFFAGMRAGHAGQMPLWSRPLAQDLQQVWVLDHDTRVRFVRRDEVEQWPLDEAALHALALENLAARPRSRPSRRLQLGHARLVCQQQGDGWDATRVLLPGVWAELRRAAGGAVALSAPHRDLLVAAPLHDAACVAVLQRYAVDAMQRAPHPISAALLVLGEEGLRAYDPSARHEAQGEHP